MTVRKLVEEEYARADEIFAIAFESPLTPGQEPGGQGTDVFGAFTDNGDLMSVIYISNLKAGFDGTECSMGGVGGVASLPQYRRGGSIRGIFEKALPYMYSEGKLFSYLYPFSTSFYRKFGYECCVRRLVFRIDPRQLQLQENSGYFRLAEGSSFNKDIITVERLFAAEHNMYVLPDEKDERFSKPLKPHAGTEYTYVCYSEEGKSEAFTQFHLENRPDGRALVCNRFCYVNSQGFNTLMQVFRSLSADHTYVEFSLPFDSSAFYALPEWSLGAASATVAQAGMVRVINVQEVLKRARCKGDGQLVIGIRDAYIPENCGSFSVSFSDGHVDSVKKTDAGADVEMSIGEFSALICGVCDLKDYLSVSGTPLVYKRECIETAERLFFRKKLMISDYF